MEAMTRNRRLLLFGIALLLLGACRPEDDLLPTSADACPEGVVLLPAPPDTCFELPRDPFNTPLATLAPKGRHMPSFNPRDPDQFVCVIDDTANSGAGLLAKIDFCTGEESYLVFFGSNNPAPAGFGRPLWGATGWVAYTAGAVLELVRADGDSLIQLTGGKYPAWFEEGARIHIGKTDPGTIRNLLIDPATGEITDTLFMPVAMPRYRKGLVAVQFDLFEIGYLDLTATEYHSLVQLPFDPMTWPKDLAWLDDERIAWAADNGIFSVHLSTAEVDTIRYTPCENKYYHFLSVPNDNSNRILANRSEYRYYNSDSLVLYHELAFIHLETDEEWIVNFE